MYTTCIFCHHDLGRNEVLEDFPVGRRVAFDAARGRLWAVCRRCERWNLSPLDTRWEAIEACERLFHDTRLRVSSDNIGLARHKEGLELVRVGDPLRHEFAAWRYGDQFGRRRKRALLYTGAAATAGGAIVVGGTLAGLSIGGMYLPIVQGIQNWWRERTIHRLVDPAGRPISVQRKHLYTSRLVPGPDGTGWELHADHVPGWKKSDRRSRMKAVDGSGWELERKDGRRTMIVGGDEAVRLAGRLMAHANRRGGKKKSIRAAVERIEAAGHPDAYLPLAASEAATQFRRSGKTDLPAKKIEKLTKPIPGTLAGLPEDTRLAIEMATQEQAEREALEGEIKGLEAMWRQAEEIAQIADDLFVPASVEAFIVEERARRDRETAGGAGSATRASPSATRTTGTRPPPRP